MSYDFHLRLPIAGRPNEEIATSDSEEMVASDLNPEKEIRKRRVADALKRHNPQLQPSEFDYQTLAKLDNSTVEDAQKKHRHIELNGPEEGTNGIQITIFDNEASITVPYWHKGDAARRVFEEIRGYLDVMQTEGGYFTYDPQIEKVLDLQNDLAISMACYATVVGDAGAKDSIARPKRWWEFWK